MTTTMMREYMIAQMEEINEELRERNITSSSENYQTEVLNWIAENAGAFREAWEEIALMEE